MQHYRNILPRILFLLVFALSALPLCAQNSAKITPRRIVLSFKDKVKSPHKVIVRYPIVSGLRNRTAERRAQSALSLSALFKGTNGATWEEMRNESWLDEADYEVIYNKNGLLDLAYSIAGSGAYPDGNTRHFVLDLKTGRLLGARDLFTGVGMREVTVMADSLMQADIRTTIADAKKDGEDIREELKNVHFEMKDLNHFSLSDKGITFIVEFGFPHVIKALEPDGSYFVPYPKLMRYLHPNSPLRAFARR